MTIDQLKAAHAAGCRIQIWHLVPGATSSADGQWDTAPIDHEPTFECPIHLYRVHPDDTAQQQASCGTCGGRGEIGGHVGQTPEQFDYVTEPCPDCAQQPARGGLPINDAIPAPTQIQPGNLFLWDWRAMQQYGRTCIALAQPRTEQAGAEGQVVAWMNEETGDLASNDLREWYRLNYPRATDRFEGYRALVYAGTAPRADVVVDDAMVEMALDAQPYAHENKSVRVWQILGEETSDDRRQVIRAALTAELNPEKE